MASSPIFPLEGQTWGVSSLSACCTGVMTPFPCTLPLAVLGDQPVECSGALGKGPTRRDPPSPCSSFPIHGHPAGSISSSTQEA